jgi:hypothetical protein
LDTHRPEEGSETIGCRAVALKSRVVGYVSRCRIDQIQRTPFDHNEGKQEKSDVSCAVGTGEEFGDHRTLADAERSGLGPICRLRIEELVHCCLDEPYNRISSSRDFRAREHYDETQRARRGRFVSADAGLLT